MKLNLSETQQNIIGNALTTSAVVLLVLIILSAFRILVSMVVHFSGVLLPLATAGVLSLLLRPVFNHMHVKWKWPGALALAAIFASVALPLAGLSWMFGAKLVNQAAQFIEMAPQYWGRAHEWMQVHAPSLSSIAAKYDLFAKLEAVAQEQSASLFGLAAGGAEGLLAILGKLTGLFNWAVVPVYIAFLIMTPPLRREELPGFFPFLKQGTRDDVVFLINQFVDIVVTFFRGQLIVAIAQGVLLAIGFSIVGLEYGFLLGLLLGMLNIVPYLGNLVGLAVTLPLAYFQVDGGAGVVGAVLVVIVIVQSIEGYVLTPKIMGDSTGLHPMVIMVAMFFWGTAFSGIIGMILAIPLTAFLVVCGSLAKEKYIKELL